MEVEKGCFLWWCSSLYIIDTVHRKPCSNTVTIMCIHSFKMCLDHALHTVWPRFIKSVINNIAKSFKLKSLNEIWYINYFYRLCDFVSLPISGFLKTFLSLVNFKFLKVTCEFLIWTEYHILYVGKFDFSVSVLLICTLNKKPPKVHQRLR